MRAKYFSLTIVVLCAGGALARWTGGPTYVPVDRMVANATAYITEEPNDPSGYYTLARIHYLAFANKAYEVATFNQGVPPSIIQYWRHEDYLNSARRAYAREIVYEEFGVVSVSDLNDEDQTAFYERVNAVYGQLVEQGWEPERPTGQELMAHAGAAQWNFNRAAALDPNNGLYYLGQASLGGQYLDYFAEASAEPMPAALRTIVLEAVKATYLLAYNVAIQEDLALQWLPLEGVRGIISYEAGGAFIRLWEAEREIPEDVQTVIAEIRDNRATLEKLPFGAITPIVITFQEHSSLTELLAPQNIVKFDLDGDGNVEERSWVKPTTGFLVWDSNGDGRIQSGRQMFGSVTWWMFFRNGYRAMDVLDDDRDHQLTGKELDDLSVWFDRNSDGVSDAGEVVPVADLGIEALGTRPNGLDGRSPMHTTGLRLKDGRTLPTYDWIAPGKSSLRK